MKNIRDRARAVLKIDVKGSGDAAGASGDPKRRIQAVTDMELEKMYKLGGMVMESTNTGMDIIFAKRLKDNTDVVIKTRIKKESFKSSSEEREWRTTTEYQMNMPTVETLCQFFEVLETRSTYYVVMEKVDGQDLFEQMAREKLTAVESRDVMWNILQGLHSMHSDGRIHRDLKIENVMISENQIPASPGGKKSAEFEPCSPKSAKLIDFDTVQDWEPSSPKAKDVLGTDGYIAPEAYGGDYSPASDVYSAGVILFKMMTAKFPSRADIFDDQPGENYVGSAAMKRIQARLEKEVINYNLHPLDKIPEAQDLLKLMLSYDPAGRPTAEEAMNHPFFRMDASKLNYSPAKRQPAPPA